MTKRRRRRDDDEREEIGGRAAATQATARHGEPSPGEPAATVLDLQARAGNRAVAGLLAGVGPAVLREAVVQRAPAAGGGGESGKDKAPARATMAIPDLDRVFDLLSVGVESRSPGGRSVDRDEQGARIGIVMAIGPDAPVLAEAYAAGRSFDRVVVTTGGLRLDLGDVVISAYQVGQEYVAMTVDCRTLRVAE